MSKKVCILLTLISLFTNILSVNADIKYVYEKEAYNYRDIFIAKNKKTGEIIPLCTGSVYDECSYAYLPGDDEIVTEIGEIHKFPDCGGYQLSSIGKMYATGVMSGYPDGTFRPQTVLTRCEMAAVFCRMFSIKPVDTPSVFKDVPADHWASGYIMALVEKGVLKKDVNFNPDSQIINEQFYAMLYRSLQDMGYTGEKAEYDFSKFIDYNDVSDYAKEPYTFLAENNFPIGTEVVDRDFLDTADDLFKINPQTPVTREECAENLYQFTSSFFRNYSPAILKSTAPDVDIPVLDGSTSTYGITENIYFLYYNNSKNHQNMPKAHSKTSNSYKRLIDGEVEMIFVPDPGEEIIDYANKNGVTLEYIPIAGEALVFFTGKNNSATQITTEQLEKIYINNSIKNWSEIGGPDAPLTAFCRNEDSGSHAQIDKFVLKEKEINKDIQRERTSVIMSSIFTDLADFEAFNPGSFGIGYSLYYYYYHNAIIDPRDFKLLSIDGVAPSDAAIADQSYPYTTRYYAVIRKDASQSVKDFARLMQGEFGKEVILRSGYGTLDYPAGMPIDF